MAQTEDKTTDIFSNLTKNYRELVMRCPSCENLESVVKTVEINLPGDVPKILISSTCGKCNYRDCTMEPIDLVEGTGIKITLKVNTRDDISRYISIYKMSTVKLFVGELEYEFVCMDDVIGVVETLLYNAINEFSKAYGFNDFGDNVESDLTNVESKSIHDEINPSLQLISSNSNFSEREGVRKALKTLRENFVSPDFTMEIHDEQGGSRVAPIGKMLDECDMDILEQFNDDKVRHSFFKTEKEN